MAQASQARQYNLDRSPLLILQIVYISDVASQLIRRVLQVFLASPSDVAEERNIADRVTNDLNKIIGRPVQWQIDLHKWEDKNPAIGRPQSIINPDVDECDLFIGLLWEHWGHSTGTFSSGFEEEFERAKARHQKSGDPKIWLVFKQPRPDKLTDPGPQLTNVLSFKEKQVASNDILFACVADTNGWDRFLRNGLTAHVLALSQAERSAQQGRAVTSSPTPQPTDSKEISEPHELLSGFKGQIPEQISQEFQVLGKLIENNQFEFALGEEKFLKEFDVARFHLLTSTWMSRRYTGDVLGTHEINQLYKYRSELQTEAQELFLLLRTLVADSSDAVPGWVWFRDLKTEKLSFLLFELANDDTLPELRVRAIQILGSAGIQPPDKCWDWLPLADQDVRVRWAAYEYLGSVADLNALPLLEKSDENESDAYEKYRARLRILARHDPEQAFLDLIAGSDYASDEMVRLIGPPLDKINTAALSQGLTSSHQHVREVSATELAKRGELSIADAEKLTADVFIPIRKIGFEELISRGKPIDLDKIKESFSERRDTPFSQLGRQGRLSDMLYGMASSPPDYSHIADFVTLTFFRTLPSEELQKRIDWLEVSAPVAYRCLTADHYDSISAYVRRDIEEGFRRIRAATFERIEAEHSAEAVTRLRNDIEKLDGFIRDEFLEAALTGLVSHAEASDLEMARNYLSHPRIAVKGAALEIVCRFGTPDDVPALIAISNEASGELKEKAARCALRFSANPFEMARTFSTSHTSEIASIGFRWLLEDSSAAAKELFDNLLNDESEAHRERAIYYLTTRATEPQMQKVLEDYLASESHYYNVTTWLDRFLHAPAPLSGMYRRWLAEKM